MHLMVSNENKIMSILKIKSTFLKLKLHMLMNILFFIATYWASITNLIMSILKIKNIHINELYY